MHGGAGPLGLTAARVPAAQVFSPLCAQLPAPSTFLKKENQEDAVVAYLANSLLAVEEDNLLHK